MKLVYDIFKITPGLSKSQTLGWVRKHLPLPAVLVAFGCKPVAQQPCPFRRHPNYNSAYIGGKTRTAFCVYRARDADHFLWYCHNADCNRKTSKRFGFSRGDVIDFYMQKMADLGYWFSPLEAAKRLMQMMEEDFFDLTITDLIGNDAKCIVDASIKTTNTNSDAYTEMYRELRAIVPDQPLIWSIANVRKIETSCHSFSVASICRVLLQDYPDDAWMMASSVKNGGYLPLAKRDWLRDGRLCRQQFLFPICFSQRAAKRIYILDRKWAVVEFDSIDRKYQLSLLFYIAEQFPGIPLHLVVDSRGRSYHGWFGIDAVTQEEYFDMFRLARRLGCDPASVKPELRCRMPNGCRPPRPKQRIVWMSDYFREKVTSLKGRRIPLPVPPNN